MSRVKKTVSSKIKYSKYEVFRDSFVTASFTTIILILLQFGIILDIIRFEIIQFCVGLWASVFLIILTPSLIFNKFYPEELMDFEELRFEGNFDELSLELENKGLSLQRKVGEYYLFKVMDRNKAYLPEVRVRECGNHCILSVAEIFTGRFDQERFISKDRQEEVNTEI